MDSKIIIKCAEHNVPFSKETVKFNEIYSFNVAKVPVLEIFIEYFNNRGGRMASLVSHISKIKSSIIKDGNMDAFPPIFVDINTNQIVDGNCRFRALKSIIEEGLIDLKNLTLKVIYIDVPKNEFNNYIITLNTTQKSWSVNDVVQSYANENNPSYVRLVKFCKDTETFHDGERINPRYGAAALNIPAVKLKDPSLVITDEDIQRGEQTAKEAIAVRLTFCKDLKSNGGGWYEPFLQAWAGFRNALEDISFKRYITAAKMTVRCKKRDVPVPYGSNKKADWNLFFRAVESYARKIA